MDYIFLSSLMGIAVACVLISYDIACQWSRNLTKRVKAFPLSMQEAHLVHDVCFTVCLAEVGQARVEAHGNANHAENKYRQIFRIKEVHYLATFLLLYVGVAVTIGGMASFLTLRSFFEHRCHCSGWSVTYIVDIRPVFEVPR